MGPWDFVEWEKKMELHTGRKVKVLRSDSEGEYRSDQFMQLCKDEDIVIHFIVKEIPQRNWVTENLN